MNREKSDNKNDFPIEEETPRKMQKLPLIGVLLIAVGISLIAVFATLLYGHVESTPTGGWHVTEVGSQGSGNGLVLDRRDTPVPVTDYLKTMGADTEDTTVDNFTIFVGDSRTVHMSYAVTYDPNLMAFVALSGGGYAWLSQTGIYEATALAKRGGCNVVVNLGVNDIDNVDRYAALINKTAEEWFSYGCRVFYASVNPVDSWFPNVSNEQLDTFNEKLKSQLSDSIIWLDTNSYLKEDGFATQDGLHYTEDTSKKIFDYLTYSVAQFD